MANVKSASKSATVAKAVVAKVPAAQVAAAAAQAKSNAATAASRAANPIASMAAVPTGNVLGKQQKLVYASGTAGLKLVPAAARGAAQRTYLAQLQAAYKGDVVMAADALVAALAAANVSNPRRTYRRAIRAGILVTA